MLIWIGVVPASRLLKFAADVHSSNSSAGVALLTDGVVVAPNVTLLEWNRGAVSAVHTTTVIRNSSVEKHSLVASVWFDPE